MDKEKEKILVVDDDIRFRQRLCRALARRGYEPLEAGDFDSGLAVFTNNRPHLAIIDLRMPGKSGLDLLKAGLAVSPDTRVVVLTGYGSIATAIEAVKAGAVSYLSKPADPDEIIKAFSEKTGPTQTNEISPPSLARMEWEHINRVMSDCDNNISEAARRLGLHRRTLQRKLQKYPPKS